MKTAWFVWVVAACGSAPAEKPVDNVVKAPPYSCDTAVDAKLHATQLDDTARGRARTEMVAACREDHWPDDYVKCTTAGTASCPDARTPAQQTREKNAIVMAGLPLECVDYIHAIQKLARCEKMPQASRDAMQQGVDAMMSGWNFNDLPPESKKSAMDAAAGACKQGADAVNQGAQAAGC